MKIALTGAHSTGKTTLLNALKEIEEFKHFNFIPGSAREAKKLGISINEDGDNKTQLYILGKDIENAYTPGDCVLDRCIIDNLIYASYSVVRGKVSADICYTILKVFDDLFEQYDYVFYMDPELPVTPDGIRSENPAFRKETIELFESLIFKLENPKIIRVKGTVQERIEIIKAAVLKK